MGRGELSGSMAQDLHRECVMRSVLGGIGHYLDHEHWCVERGDPDAGLDFRTSARLVRALHGRMGSEWMTARIVP